MDGLNKYFWKLFIKGYGFNGAKNFLLLQDRTENRDLKIVRINPYNDSITEFQPRRLTEIEVTDFDIIKNSIIGGYIEKRPAAFVYDMTMKTLKPWIMSFKQVRTTRD